MSIGSFLAAAAAVTTAPTTAATTRSVPGAVPGAAELILAAVFAIAALAVAYVVGAFERGSVLGPLRLDETDSPTRVLAITFLGFGLWFGLSGTYLALMHGQQIAEARQRNVEFTLSLRENALVNAIVQFIAVMAVLIADQLMIRDGSRKLGFRLRDVPRGVWFGVVGAFRRDSADTRRINPGDRALGCAQPEAAAGSSTASVYVRRARPALRDGSS